MTKISAAAARKIEAGSAIAPAAFMYARTGKAAVLAIQSAHAAKVDQPYIRTRFIVGYLAGRFAGVDAAISADMLSAAEKVLNLKGYVDPKSANDRSKVTAAKGAAKGTTASKAETRRTLDQERAYTAARTAWTRLLDEAGIATTAKRGGARANAGRKGQTSGAPASKASQAAPQVATPTITAKAGAVTPLGKVTARGTLAAPKVTAANDVGLYFKQLAALMRAFEAQNVKAMTLAQREALETARKALDAVTG